MSKRIYRKDYKPSPYLIDKTILNFDIQQNFTIVKAKISLYINSHNKQKTLTLDGEELELIDIKIDGVNAHYRLTDGKLELFGLKDAFILEVVTKIYPHNNNKLRGLYKSKSAFCTQCEAHGFRRITYFLDRPDVRSVYEVEIKTYKNFSAILSNGDLIKHDSNYALWHDPHPKPCYLFALVVGDLLCNKDTFITANKREVSLNIWCEKHNINKTTFAMKSLKNAMKWEEEHFNLSYDLDIYNIVAVDDFNMGAMENKGLNIFNASCILADKNNATDDDYLTIESIIGHEYFHNWTGNRITCQSWFELSLKEGLTVFRDQEFSSDLRFRSLKRIDDVNYLRTYQFGEDNSRLSHPVRPESYIAVDNFYTLTVYEKGAEIVRMLQNIVGENDFIAGFNKYINDFDGKAVTIDDFVSSINHFHRIDIDKFMLWYSTAGTQNVIINNQDGNIVIKQNDSRITPIKYAIFKKDGTKVKEDKIILSSAVTNFDLSKYKDCHISWNRDFTAPVNLVDNLNNKQRLFLIKHDDNDFVRCDNVYKICVDAIMHKTQDIFDIFDFIVSNDINLITLSLLLDIPNEKYIHSISDKINANLIHNNRERLELKIANKYIDYFIYQYELLNHTNYTFDNAAIIRRRVKNIALRFICRTNNYDYAYKQFLNANCMTDKIASFKLLLTSPVHRQNIIERFYNEYKNHELVINKWFGAIALNKKTTHSDINELIAHPVFTLTNPSKVYSLIGGFCDNFINFHNKSGYALLTDIIVKLNNINPQVGAKLTTKFANLHKFDDEHQLLQQQFLTQIKNTENISDDILEIVNNILDNMLK